MTDISVLKAEYRRLKSNHQSAIVERTAKVALGSSMIRVFDSGTKPGLRRCLKNIDFRELQGIRSQAVYQRWFVKKLNGVARVIIRTNPRNPKIYPGYKWGHGAKVLSVFVRDLVTQSRYFTDKQVERLSQWLYVPLDGVVIRRLRKLGVAPPFKLIKEVDSKKKFFAVQDLLGMAAREVGVPCVWFDDIWGIQE